MGIAGSLMVIAIAWWLAFLAMLPFGVKTQIEHGEVVPGSEPSAPIAPNLGKKAAIAFVVALILWAALFSVIEFQLIALDDIPMPSGIRWK
jgi:predicted secreted protein